MNEIQGTAGGRGHVRAVFSERCRGFAAPLDLVRAHLRAVAGVISGAIWRPERRPWAKSRAVVVDADDLSLRDLEARGRVRASFADYLVSDCSEGAGFSDRRAGHQYGVDRLFVTGGRVPLACDRVSVAGWPLDAPEVMPAGACEAVGYLLNGSVQVAALREPVEDSGPAFVAGRFWRAFVANTDTGRSGPAGLIVDNEAVRYGFAVDCLDAPEFMASGGMIWREWNIRAGGFVGQGLAMRGAL